MSTQSTLTSLLPNAPYTLAYALPLLFLSLLLTFSGTFLILDRTRAFPKNADGYQSVVVPGSYEYGGKKRDKWWREWRLEGGVGGLAVGWCFGVHLSTFLSLLIPATTSSSPLGRKSFLAVWLLSCAVTTPLAGRYRYAALVFAPITGGTLFSLSLSVLLHPALPTRIILTSILTPLFLLLTFIFSIPRLAPRFQHAFLRLSTSSSGAFGVVVSIALLSRPPIEGWANVWERLWVSDGAAWGTGKERGLSAAWGILFTLGMLSDWALRRWVGECPDQKWDACLATYAATLPHRPDRAGVFKPATSFWDRWFSASQPLPGLKDDILFPSESDMKSSLPLTHSPLTRSDTKLTKVRPPTVGGEPLNAPIPQPYGFLKKSRTQKKDRKLKSFMDGARGKRRPVKFGEFSDSSDDDEGKDVGGQKDVDMRPRPFVIQNLGSYSYASSQSERTLVGDNGSKRSGSGSGSMGKENPLASSSELDITATLPVLGIDYDADLEKLKAMKRGFGQLNDEDYSDWEDGEPRRVSPPPPAFIQQHPTSANPAVGQGMITPPIPGSVSVPATPSLIRAVERIVSAQRDVFGIPQPQPQPWPLPPLSSTHRVPSVKHMPRPSYPDIVHTAAPAVSEFKHSSSPPLRGSTPSRRPEGLPRTHTSPDVPVSQHIDEEDADDVDLEQGQPQKAERAPRWEEFWREVKMKTSGTAGEELERPERAVAR